MSVPQQKIFNLVPSSLNEALEYAKLVSESAFCPRDYKGKPGDILVAMQMGAELGLKPLQAIQNVAVINGRPSVWGDACLAIVKAHRDFEDINEYIAANEEGIETAYCTVKRRGQTEQTREFSVEDAKKAGLISKAGTWTQYPKRMLQMRARGFALRDTFADALKGLILAEEAMDFPSEVRSSVITEAPHLTKLEKIKAKLKISEVPVDIDSENINHQDKPPEENKAPIFTAEELEQMMKNAKSKDDLDTAVSLISEIPHEERANLRVIYSTKRKEFN